MALLTVDGSAMAHLLTSLSELAPRQFVNWLAYPPSVLCTSPAAECDASALSSARGTNVILSGAFTDFVPGWYIDVGQSLEIIIILNAVLTGMLAWPSKVSNAFVAGMLSSCCLS